VDTPLAVGKAHKGIGVGRAELGKLPVIEYVLDNIVFAAELAQHLGIGGIACLGLFEGRQTELLEKLANK